MRRARLPFDAPSRCRRRGRFRRWVRDKKARRRRLSRSKAETARRRQIRFVKGTDDDGHALRPETFLDRIQRFAGARRLDDEEARRIKPQAGKADR